MKAIVLEQPGRVLEREMPEPALGPDDVLVSVHFAGICGTDMHVFLGEMSDRVKFPAVLGHESAGVVADVGRNVKSVKPGDRVVIDPVLSCGRCARCREGKPNCCPAVNVLGIDSFGAMAQRVAVPSTQVHPVADTLDLEHCVLVELYAVAVHASRRTDVQVGDYVAIFGAGKLGLALLDVFRLTGAGRIVVVDIAPERLAIAEKLGADRTINARQCDPVKAILEETDGAGADKTIEAVGHYVAVPGLPAPTEQAFEAMRSGGQVTILGQGAQKDSVYWRPFVLKEGTVVASRLNVGDVPRAIRLLEFGRLHPELLLTHRLPPGEAATGFQWLADKRPDVVKVCLDLRSW
mgnify:CR=1 FL=1